MTLDQALERRSLEPATLTAAEMQTRHPSLTAAVCEEVHDQFASKQKHGAELKSELQRIGERWSQIQEMIRSSCPSASSVEATLRAAGCVMKPSELGVSRERLCRTIKVCREIRNRYVALDLMADLGVLEPWADDVANIIEGADG